jgi:hypothetical protein
MYKPRVVDCRLYSMRVKVSSKGGAPLGRYANGKKVPGRSECCPDRDRPYSRIRNELKIVSGNLFSPRIPTLQAWQEGILEYRSVNLIQPAIHTYIDMIILRSLPVVP